MTTGEEWRHISFTLSMAVDGGGWINSSPGRFTLVEGTSSRH